MDHPGRPVPGSTRRDLLTRAAPAGVLASLGAGGLLAGDRAVEEAVGAEQAGTATAHLRLYPLTTYTPQIDLRGKVAVITGASTGIGRATGEALAARGVHVIGTSRDVAGVKHLPAFRLYDLDISRSASIEAFVRRVRRQVGAGGVDILLNNAGRGIVGNPLPPSGGEDRYMAQMALGHRTDHLGHVLMTKRMQPLLPRRGYARVGFTVTAAAYSVGTGPFSYLHGYVGMKKALLAFANAWRSTLEQAGSHLKVVTVNPLAVDTRFPQNSILTEPARPGSGVRQFLDAMTASFAQGLPPSLVADAYWQLLTTDAPPPNVIVGAATEPNATKGQNALALATFDAENAQSAVPFAM